MEVFLSSVISGYEAYRAAAVEAVETLGHHVVRAEDFVASPGTPQQACLAAVRDADLVVLLMGSNYGAVQSSGLSATHEEYREARDDKPVLVFVESGVERDDAQQEFLEEAGVGDRALPGRVLLTRRTEGGDHQGAPRLRTRCLGRPSR